MPKLNEYSQAVHSLTIKALSPKTTANFPFTAVDNIKVCYVHATNKAQAPKWSPGNNNVSHEQETRTFLSVPLNTINVSSKVSIFSCDNDKIPLLMDDDLRV